ncbi:MAG: hypothetical protein DMG13_18445 [Acidobacteria bacterium]|nr:MAG: hypothetical protein DMG13_18445 [Acidobacteriota bacterium]
MRPFFVALCLCGSLALLLAWSPLAMGQPGVCPVAGLLEGPNELGCISPEERAILSEFLTAPSSDEKTKRHVLEIVSRAYRCVLAKGNVAQQSSLCFRRGLVERFYTQYKDSDLCLVDRFTRALVTLRYVSDTKLPESQTFRYQEVIDKALNEAKLAVGISKDIKTRPQHPRAIDLAERFCVDPENPVFSEGYFRELIDASAGLSIEYPQTGRYIGAVLDAILQDAKTLFEEPNRTLSDGQILIGFDRANLASTGLFYRWKLKVREIAPAPDRIRPADVASVVGELKRLEPELERAADRLTHRSEAWKYYQDYGDLLFALAEPLKSSEEDMEMRDRLVNASCKALWRGIQLSADSETSDQLKSVREKLMSRVADYGSELARNLKYGRLTEFESQFVDESGRIMPHDDQCYVHAHLAQALYVRGSINESLQHLRKSCEVVSLDDLKTLRNSILAWVKW